MSLWRQMRFEFGQILSCISIQVRIIPLPLLRSATITSANLILSGGLRLDECTEKVQVAVHSVLKASFSSNGYTKVLGCCLTNDFLGDLVHGKSVLNKHSYNFRLFGQPSLDSPWAYTFFGHHVCIAVFVQGKRMVIGPTFLGAEPDHIDEGPHAGLRLFGTEEHLSLQLMQSLSPALQEKVTISKGMDGESLPEDRWNPFDERHLGGATRDNRVVPYGKSCPDIQMTKGSNIFLRGLPSFNFHYRTTGACSWPFQNVQRILP